MYAADDGWHDLPSVHTDNQLPALCRHTEQPEGPPKAYAAVRRPDRYFLLISGINPGFRACEDFLADRRPTSRETEMPYFKPFPVADESALKRFGGKRCVRDVVYVDGAVCKADRSGAAAKCWFHRRGVRSGTRLAGRRRAPGSRNNIRREG